MAARNYIDSYYDRKQDLVIIWERDEQGNRVTRRVKPEHYFYIPDDNGEYTSIYGNKLKKLTFDSLTDFRQAADQHRTKFESDFRPDERILMSEYYGLDVPEVHYTLLDIEVDYNSEIGWARADNCYAPVNAITLFHQWKNEYVTLVLPPKSFNWDEVETFFEPDPEIEDDYLLENSNIIICRSEKELFELMLDELDDSDIISGWNSDFFDLPYLTKRTELVLGKKALQRWSFQEGNKPFFKEVERFGDKEITVKLSGRQHLDYLQLFKKLAFGGRASYALDNIAQEELGIPKLHYDGTLEELYNNDFRLFVKYNIRDVEILEKLDTKFKYIDLTNELVHVNTVPFEAVMGSIRIIDTGIINYCHHELGLIVNDKTLKPGDPIKGAMVFVPKVGFHEWIGSVDINSLYPSTMRSINISPEKIIGQFYNPTYDIQTVPEDSRFYHYKDHATSDTSPLNPKNKKVSESGRSEKRCFDPHWAWDKVINKSNQILRLDLDDGNYAEYTGAQWHDIIKDNKWSISGYGTVFDQSNGKGFIPSLLQNWYANRKKLKAEMEKHQGVMEELEKANQTETQEYKDAKYWAELYDKKQMTYKLLLNSLYGATINQYCRFYDPRLGASTTGTGQLITQFMAKAAAKILTGEESEVVCTRESKKANSKEGVVEEIEDLFTCDSPAILYGDTDSVYFKIIGVDNKDDAIEIADATGDGVNSLFPEFMMNSFLVQDDFSGIIRCGREVVADTGIFQAKKKYVLHCINVDGFDIKEGSKKSIKAMGSEIKKSDTPKVIQQFLKDVTNMILHRKEEPEIVEFINGFRSSLKDLDPRELGSTKSVNNLEMYNNEYQRYEKPGVRKGRLPGQVRAAINFNELLDHFNDKRTSKIRSGDKISVFYLKPNDIGLTSIAIPSDMDEFPDWFSNFEIDMKAVETKMVDMKLKHLYNAIGWEVPDLQSSFTNDLLVF